MIRALLFDVDGTLAETERDGHRVAFNAAFAALNVPWRWSEARYGELLRVAGGRERLLHDMQSQPQAPASSAEREELARRVHEVKNRCYQQIVRRGSLPLRDGVVDLMADCERAGTALGVVTTTSRGNLAALLGRWLGGAWSERFAAIVCAEDAPLKKPHPQAYERALQILALTGPQTVAVEDSPAGVSAARGAEVPVLVTASHYFPNPPEQRVLAWGRSLGGAGGWRPEPRNPRTRVTLEQIQLWRLDEPKP